MVGLLSFCSNLLTYLGTALLLWPFRCTKNNANSEAPFGSALVVAACTSQNSPSETVWKFGIALSSGCHLWVKGCEEALFGRLQRSDEDDEDPLQLFSKQFLHALG